MNRFRTTMSADAEPTGCSEEKETSMLWKLAVMVVIIGAILWSTTQPEHSFSSIVVLVVCFIASLYCSIILHELAHAMIGLLMGLKPLRICCGQGRLLFQQRIKGANFILNARPTAG